MLTVNPLRSIILAAAGSDAVRKMITTAPGTRAMVDRFVAGESVDDAINAVAALAETGRYATLDYLGEDTHDAAQAERIVQAYLTVLDRLHDAGLAAFAEVSVKLSALGQRVSQRLAVDNAFRICAAAEQCGTTVTVDMEDHTTTDDTLDAVAELRKPWPDVGAVLQSYLLRTEDDVAALAVPGSRVRLVKGAYAEPHNVAFSHSHDVDLAFVRCANALFAGGAYAMFGTHDPRLIELVRDRAAAHGVPRDGYEFQLLYGVRPDEQVRLSDAGQNVRVYVPYGEQWYGYLMRRLAERPANTTFFLRSVVTRS
ncbi:proline dehydrogenase [Haloechinothrix halophila YIM 93223]|uniref:proline dehydrogenase n=1 Tax=Haloechinothrix halophila YIM 93223 TaxID=592678 RepID=W9DT07_9PSEU|nr:proline dehydrogenase [Haloechinothrix halophila YIM 93223]